MRNRKFISVILAAAMTAALCVGFCGSALASDEEAGPETAIEDRQATEDAGVSVPELAAAAENGDVHAMTALGTKYLYGDGVKLDKAKAFELYSRAAKLGDPFGIYAAGDFYYQGYGVVDPDWEKAAAYYEKAAKQDVPEALYDLGCLYSVGKGVKQDEAKGTRMILRAADLLNALDPDTMSGTELRTLARILLDEQSADRKPERAAALLSAATDKGDYLSEAFLGILYNTGNGVAQDYETAVRLLSEAAEHGVRIAKCELGFLYLNGLGVEQDFQKAREYYTSAAAEGHPAGIVNLAVMDDHGFGIEQPDRKKAYEGYERYLATGSIGEDVDAEILVRLTYMNLTGTGTEVDYKKAFDYASRSAEMGNADGCEALGEIYEYGFGVVAPDHAAAAKNYALAAEAGDQEAMYNLARIYESGLGVEQNTAKAQELYGQLAKQLTEAEPAGLDDMQQRLLGVLYLNGKGVGQDADKAADLLEAAVEQENWYAAAELGKCYYDGIGVEKDEQKGFELISLAADHGMISSIFNIGLAYDQGYGVEVNDEKAVQYYRKAADLGLPDAMINLAIMYEEGRGVERDYAEAKKLFEKAAARGDALAVCNLGYMYDMGLGVSQNYIRAGEFYEKAAAMGDVTAMYNLGVFYENGRGVEVDPDKAREWYQKAADAGDPDAPEALRALAERAAG